MRRFFLVKKKYTSLYLIWLCLGGLLSWPAGWPEMVIGKQSKDGHLK